MHVLFIPRELCYFSTSHPLGTKSCSVTNNEDETFQHGLVFVLCHSVYPQLVASLWRNPGQSEQKQRKGWAYAGISSQAIRVFHTRQVLIGHTHMYSTSRTPECDNCAHDEYKTTVPGFRGRAILMKSHSHAAQFTLFGNMPRLRSPCPSTK